MLPIQFDNFTLDFVLVFSSLLLVVSVLLSRISSKFGLPSLLLFLVLGMLAGSDGPGNIPFDNYKIAFAVGSVCLAFIIFDGGLRTSWSSVRPILPTGISLSFAGTTITAIVTGVFSHYILGLKWPESLLLGAIVSSTDAAAVFGILRSRGLSLKNNLKQTLEFEAGSNDPVAVFLTLAVLMYITSASDSWSSFVLLFVRQTGLGLFLGWYGAKAFQFIVNKAGVEFEGLYGVLATGLVILLFSTTSYLGGSGFLAVYVAGLYLGNNEYIHKSTIVRFIDGVAWISQIVIFLALGLLVFPTKLIDIWKEGLLLAFFMMLVARPLSVLIAGHGKNVDNKSRMFISWIGLRGAAPIILATLPWTIGLPNAEYIFNLVFFIVLISVIMQGATIPWIAAKLTVTEPIPSEPVEEPIGALPTGFELIKARVLEDSPANKKRIVELGLPAGVLLTSIERNGRYHIPQGGSVLETGDKLTGFSRESNIDILRGLFGEVRKL